MSLHLSDDQLVDRLYEICDAGTEHLRSCAECQQRWMCMQARREQLIDPLSISNQQLRQQRRVILNRLAEQPPALRLTWMPVAAAVVLIAGFVFTPKVEAPAPVVSQEAVEAGWFEDTYSATRVIEPRAATPIRQLFWKEVAE